MKRSGKCIAGSALVGTLALIGFAVTSSLSRSSGTSTRRPDIVDLATGTTAAPYATITQPDIEAATVADFKYPTAAAKDPNWNRDESVCETIYKTPYVASTASTQTMCCSRTEANFKTCQKLYEHTSGKRIPVSPHACLGQCTGVETTEIAHYEIVYSAMDQTLNEATERKVLVSFVDTMPPTLSQPADEAIEPCDQYDAPTVHATDAVDGDLTPAVERTGVYFYPNGISLSAIDTDANACPSSGRDSETFNFVDTSYPGTYCTQWCVSDKATPKNEACVKQMVTVAYPAPPTIELSSTHVEMECGSRSPTVFDKLAQPTDFSVQLTCLNPPTVTHTKLTTVDTNTVGGYNIVFTASPWKGSTSNQNAAAEKELSAGSTAVVVQKFEIKDTIAPVITCPADVTVIAGNVGVATDYRIHTNMIACIDTRQRTAKKWVKAGVVKTKDAAFALCANTEYMSLECPTTNGFEVWCMNSFATGTNELHALDCMGHRTMTHLNGGNAGHCSGPFEWVDVWGGGWHTGAVYAVPKTIASVLVAPVFAAKLVRYTAPKTTTASHTQAWDIESDFCKAKDARLPTFKEICPNGAGGDSAPALGCEPTHSWMPYAGQHGKNSWVFVGCGGHGGIVCKDHVKHHGNPGWGSGDVYGDKVDCMHT